MAKSKKIILPPRSKTPTYKRSDVVLLPDLQGILEDAASIVSTELAKFKRRAETASAGLDIDAAKTFQGYVKSAIDLSREARERDKESDVEDVSDSELLNMYLSNLPKEEVVRLLQDTINDKSKDKKEAPDE